MRVFRDTAGLGASPDLWGSVTSALDQSEWLLVLLSPPAAHSEWVAREIEHWIQTKGTDRILLALTDGDLQYDTSREGFDPDRSTSLPEPLRRYLKTEPYWIDLRGLDLDGLDLRDPRFREAIARISATIHGMAVDELVGEDHRQQVRQRRVRRLAISAVAMLAISAIAVVATLLSSVSIDESDQPQLDLPPWFWTAVGSLVGAVVAVPVLAIGWVLLRRVARRASAHRIRRIRRRGTPSAPGTSAFSLYTEAWALLTRLNERHQRVPYLDAFVLCAEQDLELARELARALVERRGGWWRRDRFRIAVGSIQEDAELADANLERIDDASRLVYFARLSLTNDAEVNEILGRWILQHSASTIVIAILEGSVGTTPDGDVDADVTPSILEARAEETAILDVRHLASNHPEAEGRALDGLFPLLNGQSSHRQGPEESVVRPIGVRRRDAERQRVLTRELATTLGYPDAVREVISYDEVSSAMKVAEVQEGDLETALMRRREEIQEAMAQADGWRALEACRSAAVSRLAIHHRVRVGALRRIAIGSTAVGVMILLAALCVTAAQLLLVWAVPDTWWWENDLLWVVWATGLALLLAGHVVHWLAEPVRLRSTWKRYDAAADLQLEKSVVALRAKLAEEHLLEAAREDLVRALARDPVAGDKAREAPGLAPSAPHRYQVRTEVSVRLEEHLARPAGATIGIAGPRGSGKSTVLQELCVHPRPTAAGSRPRLGVLVAAPVDYSAAEFIQHVVASLCRSILDASVEPRAIDHRRSVGAGRFFAIVAIAVLIAAPAAGASARVLMALVAATAVTAAGVTLARFARRRRMHFSGVRRRDESGATSGEGPVDQMDDPVVNLAAGYLDELVYQSQTTRQHEVGVPLSKGLSFKSRRSEQRSRKPWSTPEAIYRFKELVDAVVGAGWDVVIGIDELDKIDTDEQAIRFLNEIKGLFGARGCYALVTVSESAMISFEQRGLPFRNAFDSSLDDVVQVGYLTQPEAIELLQKRVIGFDPFVAAFCHCFSGGLPRDLLRAARRANSMIGRCDHRSEALACFIHDEASAKLRAVLTSAALLDRDTPLGEVVNAAEVVLSGSDYESSGLSGAAQGLMSACSSNEALKSAEPGVQLRILELAVFFDFLSCISAISERHASADVDDPADAMTALAQLTQARQDMEVDPSLAWTTIESFRKARWLDSPRSVH